MAKKPAAANATEALAMAREAESPVTAYGYFVAKDGKRYGAPDLAAACEAFWRALPEIAPGPTDGVSAWRWTDGTNAARITRTEATGERSARDIDWDELAKLLA